MLKTDRTGLVIVTASLSAIAAIAYLVFHNQYADRLTDIREQGVSLARLLSGMPVQQLAPDNDGQGVLQVMRYGINNPDFGYISVVAADGTSLNEQAMAGVIVPPPRLPGEPSAWLGEVTYPATNLQPAVIEYHAPMLSDGELSGFVRVGYRAPKPGINAAQLPFFAAMALPVFLLVPLFYLLLRLEIRPLKAANREIGKLLSEDSFRTVEVSASGELADFMQRFNRFVELAGSRISGLEDEQKRLVTSKKLLTYRKNRVETVLETIPEAVLILDESGMVTFANQKLAAMFGVTQQVILDKEPQEWCEHADILQLLHKHQVNGSGRNFNDTIRFNLDAQANQAIVTKSYPLFAPDRNSSAIGTLIIFRDETTEALARQARGDFVTHLAHELKAPLNVLSMYSETMMSEAGNAEAFRIEAANVISDEVRRLGTLITGLLSITQIENGSLTPDRNLVKLRDVASAAFDEARHSASDKRCRFEFDAPKEMGPMLLDKDLIRIAITNLLSNAVKYNRDGGLVRLSIEDTDDAVQIRVTDSGIGVSDEEAAKIFDKFYRSTDDRVQSITGHGLGLALTRQIVELHHGSLSLNQDRAEGAEFIINLWKETSAVRQAI